MGKKKYPEIIEDGNPVKCGEPTVGYAATGSGYMNTMVEQEDVPQIPVGRLGFYTDDLDVFEARVAEIEADLDEVDAGFEDSEKWMTSEQFDQELFRQFPWLR